MMSIKTLKLVLFCEQIRALEKGVQVDLYIQQTFRNHLLCVILGTHMLTVGAQLLPSHRLQNIA